MNKGFTVFPQIEVTINRENLVLFQSKNFLYLNYFSTKNVSYLKKNS